MKLIWNRRHSLRCIYVFLLSATLSHAANKWKSLNHEISHAKKNWTHKTTTSKNFGPTKFSREKPWTDKNTHKINFGPTKYLREKILDPRNNGYFVEGTRPSRFTMTRDPWSLAHSTERLKKFIQESEI